jgi:hypothetical protein
MRAPLKRFNGASKFKCELTVQMWVDKYFQITLTGVLVHHNSFIIGWCAHISTWKVGLEQIWWYIPACSQVLLAWTLCTPPKGTNPWGIVQSIRARAYDCPYPKGHAADVTCAVTCGTFSPCWSSHFGIHYAYNPFKLFLPLQEDTWWVSTLGQ